MAFSQHDVRDCRCVQFKPDFTVGDLKLTGENYFCSSCHRYVSSIKWKGGLVHFGKRTRFVKYFFCPCCGYRMRRKTRAKKKIISSIEDQVKHPENYTPYVRSKLEKKVKLLETNFLIPTVT
jgi:hypothetical protein